MGIYDYEQQRKKKSPGEAFTPLRRGLLTRPELATSALPTALTQAGATAPRALDAALARRPVAPQIVGTYNNVQAQPDRTNPLQAAAAQAAAEQSLAQAEGGGAVAAPALQRPTFNGVQAGGTTGPDYQRSNVPGTAVINGRVISPERIAALAGPNTAPAATGNYAVPQPVLQQPQGPVNGAANPNEAARFAASDLNSIATGDFRSVAGQTARNARNQIANFTPSRIGTTKAQRQTQVEANAANANATLDALTQSALQRPVLAADRAAVKARSADIAFQEAGATQRTLIGADAGVEQARLQRPDRQQTITLEDGSLAQIGENGLSRPVLGPDGKAVRAQQGKAPTDQAAYAKFFEIGLSQARSTLGVDEQTGQVRDFTVVDPKDKNAYRPITPEDIQKINAAAQQIALQALNVNAGSAPTTAAAKPTKEQFMAQARQQSGNSGYSDADLEKYYMATYGG